jgi:hypothetical protein
MPTRSAVARFLARVVAVARRSFSSFCLPRAPWKRGSSMEQQPSPSPNWPFGDGADPDLGPDRVSVLVGLDGAAA